jgi:membrane protease YdiL (CAAX protease family)
MLVKVPVFFCAGNAIVKWQCPPSDQINISSSLLTSSGDVAAKSNDLCGKSQATMNTTSLSKNNWLERSILALVFFVSGAAIVYYFNPWQYETILPKTTDYLLKIGVCVLLLVLSLVTRNNQRLHAYWQLLFALFVLTLVYTLDFIVNVYILDYLKIPVNTPTTIALQKLNEALIVISAVIGCTLASGNDLGSIYIQKGNWKLGLKIGLVAFFLAALLSIPMATFFKTQNLTISRALPWIPWVLIFVLANAALEETLFRGLFLRKLERFFGKLPSNILIAVVFTLIHGAATYPRNQYAFLLVVFPLALVWGYITQKTEGLWGSILFHAGMDISIILGIFSNM